MKRVKQRHRPFRRFLSSEDGGVMVMGAIVLPIIAGAAVFALDHAMITQKIASLQRAADKTAIAVARELPLIKETQGAEGRTLTAVAQNYAEQSLPDAILVTTAERDGDNIVGIRLTQSVDTPLNKIFGGKQELSAQAKAEAFGGQNICIISTDRGFFNQPGIELDNLAKIEAGDCGIYSNSNKGNSIVVRSNANINASFVCSAGGYEGSPNSVSTGVTTDCPQVTDPLRDRPKPPEEACDPNFPTHISEGESVNLTPGTYCGGLTIQGDANVWFTPGIYRFKDGPLYVQNDATVGGEEVGLFFEDMKSFFEFRNSAEVSFSAPETGPMAGIVVSAKEVCLAGVLCPTTRRFKISSANVRSLLGTIYLPKDDLEVDTTAPISEEAAFTILIVDNLIMKQSPSLVLNTDYAATTVPVPDGFVGEPDYRLIE